MKTYPNLVQGSQEWLDLRMNFFTASEAGAAAGKSKYMKRDELLLMKKTGESKEVEPFLQKIFNKGHAAEKAIMPVIERIIDDELYPVTGSLDNLLASFDGLTMMQDIVFEHKLFNEVLAEQINSAQLDYHYWSQLEQQIYIAGAEKAFFACSNGDEESLVWMWYYPVPGRIEELKTMWAQFDKDLTNFSPTSVDEPPKALVLSNSLPELYIDVVGEVTETNFPEYKAKAVEFFKSINTDLVNDQDFADAESQVKFCKEIEEKLELVKSRALSKTITIKELFDSVDEIQAAARTTRLDLDKKVKSKKVLRKGEIVKVGLDAIKNEMQKANQEFVNENVFQT